MEQIKIFKCTEKYYGWHESGFMPYTIRKDHKGVKDGELIILSYVNNLNINFRAIVERVLEFQLNELGYETTEPLYIIHFRKVNSLMQDRDNLTECECGCDEFSRIRVSGEKSERGAVEDTWYQISEYQCALCEKKYTVMEDLDDPEDNPVREMDWKGISEAYRKIAEGT